jgi:rod shape determining protein RodA
LAVDLAGGANLHDRRRHLFSAAGGSWSPWALKQALTILAFFGLAVAISYIPRALHQAAYPSRVMSSSLLLLIAVEMIGFVGKGAQRWIDLGFIRLQPSEFMKPGVVLVLARFYDLLPVSDIRRWRGLWPAALLVLVPWALILVQPDMGTATMVLVGGATIMFVAGLPMWYFLSAAAAAGSRPVPILFSDDA